MANSFDTSFIPQQPLLKSEGFSRRAESVSLILIVALIVFFATVAVYGGVFFYKINLDKKILGLEKELQSREEKLNIADIDRYKNIDARIGIAKGLLNNHVQFSNVLTLIEKITPENVGWSQLSFTVSNNEGKPAVSLSGQAPNYGTVYSLGEQWRTMTKDLKKVQVSTPRLDLQTGIVSFSADIVIDPSIFHYQVSKEGISAP